ncbi:lysis system o-spanin lipoprotein Rz1 [Erwinia sp. HDF1-3R]|uniref:lysis system o-spanin lipoprotein Rz1 n=1 Tax=Erwinia sp. HDF1-3R TaxID=3141543 RepID=UPI00093A40D7|nr:lysis system o-spanin lipoprotein Rz1 [Erwinia sp. ErVv1]
MSVSLSILSLLAAGCSSPPPAIAVIPPPAWMMQPAPDLITPLNGIISLSGEESKSPERK